MSLVTVEVLTADDVRTNAPQELCELVRDAVAGGASVGWVTVPSGLEAAHYWPGVAGQVHGAATNADAPISLTPVRRYAARAYIASAASAGITGGECG